MPRFQKALAQLMGQEGEQRPLRDERDGSGTVVSELRARVSSTEIDLITPFATAFLQNARLLENLPPPSEIAGLTLGACRFLCDRHTLPLTLRAYVPTAAEHGWTSTSPVLEIATDDQPGMVTSLCGVVEQQGARIEAILSASLQVDRDDTGLAKAIRPASGTGDESLIHMQLAGVANLTDLESVTRRHIEALGRTRRESVPLQEALQQLIDQLSKGTAADREVGELLAWLADGRMTIAGFEDAPGGDGSARRLLGIYADAVAGIEPSDAAASTDATCLVKTRARDAVHAGQFLDELRIRATSTAGAAPSVYRVAGSLGARAFRDPTSGVPMARNTYTTVVEKLGGADDRVRRVFDELPVDLVLSAAATDLAALVQSIIAADAQPSVRVVVTPGPASGAPTCFLTVLAPRQHLARSDADRVSQLVRERLAPILARHSADDELAVVRMHYTLDADSGQLRPELIEDLAAQLRRVLSSWREAPAGERPRDPDSGAAAPPRQPPQQSQPVFAAVTDDIEFHPDGSSSNRFVLRVAAPPTAVGFLGELVNTLDHLGARVIRHGSTVSQSIEVHELSVELAGDRPIEASRVADILRSMRAGAIESDALCSLSWRAGLGAASIDILRAFGALAEGLGITARTRLDQAIIDNPGAAEALVRAFEVKFDPRLPVANDAQRRRDLVSVREHFDAAAAVAGDRASRRALHDLGDLLDSTVRTSFFCGDRHRPGRPLALKLRGGQGSGSPYRTFVHAPGFEAVLLRGGLASRPVLRLAEDIASLYSAAAIEMADQTLRAAQTTTDPGCAVLALKSGSAAAGAADRALREFLNAVLDVTDDIANGELARNPSVVAHDEADSYFSISVGERPTGWAEVARQVVRERGFWMGDAAVARLDEKVAAEGAWAALHGSYTFASALAEAAATVVAIGSPQNLHLPDGARLVAAIDDHEIFLAPSVEAANCSKAMEELRRRGGSSWSDFPIDLRGPGGAVIRRDSRKVELGDEARALLEWTDGGGADELARAVLALGANLLWVRGNSVRVLTRAEMTGRASEQLEVEVARVGARSVAEIGDSLFSPAARVEFALLGRTVHTPAFDAIAADMVADRVSNVELSLSLAGANREVIEAHSSEVAAELRQVATETPRRQVVAVGLDQRRSRDDWYGTAACIQRLRRQAAAAALDLHFASDLDLDRQGASDGLTRPEITVLRSIAALRLQREVHASSLCKDPYLRPWIDDYFPAPISRQFPDLVDHHPLRDEIAALAVTERLLEVMGVSFVATAAETHGRDDIEIVKAWAAVFIFGGAQEVWTEVEAAGLAPGSSSHQRHRLAIADALARATDRLLELRAVDLSLERMIDRFGGAVAEILRAWPEPLPEELQGGHSEAIDEAMQAGLPRSAADHLARITHLSDIIDVCDLAIQINSPRSMVASVFLGLEPILRFGEIGAMIRSVRHQDLQWGARAEAHLRARLSASRRGLTTEVVSSAAGRRRPIERWVEAHVDEVRAFQRLLGEVRSGGQSSSAAVEVLIGALENLARGQRRPR